MSFEEHDRKVASIAAAVRELSARGGPVHIDKGGVHHFVPLPGDTRFGGRRVDVSGLNRILEIDAEERRCTAEPGVSFAELVPRTLELGLLPMTVPELTGITLGGAVAGCSVESMSFRHGGFHDSCLEYELVSGEGQVLTCSPEKEPELFHRIHGSYGTLGILTRLTFRLVPAKRFVRLEYRAFPSFERFEAELRERCAAGDFDFIDGIVHGPERFVLCLGRFVDTAPFLSRYRRLNIYYKSTLSRSEDYLSTFDYCFRYDAECHWLSRTVPPLEWRPVRLLFGGLFLGSTNLIRWSRRLESVLRLKRRPDVVCDVFIPARSFGEFWRWYRKDFAFYPLWVVPYRIPEMYPWIAPEHAARMDDSLFIDCAVYGKPNNDPQVDASAALEEKTFELGGIKTLISRNHYSRERFWQIYDRPGYEEAKRRLDPGGVFPGLYEKFHRGG
jgi:FAD/FMN-containing dehydrogenase